jgi:hypothetical protein
MKALQNPALHLLGLTIVASWIFPLRSAVGNENPAQSPPVGFVATEIQLGEKDSLRGTVMLPGGKPAANQTVVLGREGKLLQRVTADENGTFAFTGLKPGTYQVATRDAVALVKCLPENPTTNKEVSKELIMSQEAMLARGNSRNALLHPFFVGLVILAAIAIPIAISKDNDEAS